MKGELEGRAEGRTMALAHDVEEGNRAAEALRESRRLLAEVQRIAHLGSFEWDIASDTVTWTDELYRIFGLEPGAFAGTLEAVLERVHPEEREGVRELVSRAIETGKPVHAEQRIVRPDGTIRVVESWGEVIGGPHGQAVRMIGTCQDITERRQVEEALRRAEQKYRSIIENAVEGIFQSTPEGRYLSVNPAMARMYGYGSPEEMLASITDIERQVYADPARRGEFKRLLQQRGTVKDFVIQVHRKDGSTIWSSVSARAVRDPSGELAYYEGFIEDVTERKRAEEALRESERKYRDIVAFAPIGIYQSTRGGRLLTANAAFARMLGYACVEEVLQLDMARDVYFDGAERARLIARYEASAPPGEIEVLFKRKDGSPLWVHLYAHTVSNGEGGTLCYEGFVYDIGERKRAEEALRKSEERYRTLFQNSKDAIFIVNRDGRPLEVNSSALALFGYAKEEVAGLRAGDLFLGSSGCYRFLRAIARGGAVRDLELKLRRRDGAEMDCLVTATIRRDRRGSVLGYEGIIRDVTAQRLADWALRNFSAQLLQLQDEERRRLARELHDSTGQQLAALAMNLSLAAKGSRRLAARTRKALAESQALAERCAAEIRTLSYLLHPPLLDEMGLGSALRWLAEGFEARSGIRLELELPADLGRLGREMETTLFRIVQESLTNVHRHSGSATATVRILRERRRVTLEVEDEGRGMGAGVRRSSGRGGLEGLGVGIMGMRERVRQLGGWLEVLSGGQGTTVRAVLPVREEA